MYRRRVSRINNWMSNSGVSRLWFCGQPDRRECMQLYRMGEQTCPESLHQRYLQLAKENHPDIQISNCASASEQHRQTDQAAAFRRIRRCYEMLRENCPAYIEEAELGSPDWLAELRKNYTVTPPPVTASCEGGWGCGHRPRCGIVPATPAGGGWGSGKDPFP
jgi:hypothetical protein